MSYLCADRNRYLQGGSGHHPLPCVVDTAGRAHISGRPTSPYTYAYTECLWQTDRAADASELSPCMASVSLPDARTPSDTDTDTDFDYTVPLCACKCPRLPASSRAYGHVVRLKRTRPACQIAIWHSRSSARCHGAPAAVGTPASTVRNSILFADQGSVLLTTQIRSVRSLEALGTGRARYPRLRMHAVGLRGNSVRSRRQVRRVVIARMLNKLHAVARRAARSVVHALGSARDNGQRGLLHGTSRCELKQPQYADSGRGIDVHFGISRKH